MQLTGQRIMFDLRMAIYGHLQRLDLRYYDRNPVGRLMTRVTSDVDVLNDLFTSGVVTIFGDVFTLVGIMAVMLWMDWRLALVAFSVLPLIALVTQWFRRNVRESYRVVRGWIARINAFLQENITGCRPCSCSAASGSTSSASTRSTAKHRDANIDSIFYYAVFYPAIEAIGALASALIIWYGGASVLARHADARRAGGVPAVLAALLPADQRHVGEVQRPAVGDGLVRADLQAARRAGRDHVAGAAGLAEARAESGEQGAVTSCSTTSGSPTTSDDWVLQDVSFEVKPGERLGIVGATGSGKTTLINLLLRFYDVQRGRITVDGVDIRELDLADLRGLFSLVLQDVHLFSGTIADNIRLGQRRRSTTSACGAPRARSTPIAFIERLPGGYRAPVAERGATLSVGQKQLLSFARALAFDPRVLILDEATSSVDTETELLIRDALDDADGRPDDDRHRAPAVDHPGHGQDSGAAQGRRCARPGTHQELLAARGIYFKLFELQYKNEPVAQARA